MHDQKVATVVRTIHRTSGLCLFPLLAVKIVSGLSITGELNLLPTARAVSVHLAEWIDIPLVLFIWFHAANGLLRISLAKGIKHKTNAFFITNGIALILFLVTSLFLH